MFDTSRHPRALCSRKSILMADKFHSMWHFECLWCLLLAFIYVWICPLHSPSASFSADREPTMNGTGKMTPEWLNKYLTSTAHTQVVWAKVNLISLKWESVRFFLIDFPVTPHVQPSRRCSTKLIKLKPTVLSVRGALLHPSPQEHRTTMKID